jgi:hypothetical protein
MRRILRAKRGVFKFKYLDPGGHGEDHPPGVGVSARSGDRPVTPYAEHRVFTQGMNPTPCLNPWFLAAPLPDSMEDRS